MKIFNLNWGDPAIFFPIKFKFPGVQPRSELQDSPLDNHMAHHAIFSEGSGRGSCLFQV